MGRTADSLDALVEEAEEMLDAVEHVRERLDDADSIEWEDVSDELTSGQWGRLIEKGLLQSDDDGGFVFADPDGVTGWLDGDGDGEFDFDEIEGDSSWSTYDKVAGIGVLMMMVGYYFDPVQNLIGNTMNTVLGPLEANLPFYGVILILAMLTGLYSTILQANLMNMERMRAYQDRMKAIQERMQDAKDRGDDAAVERIQQEQMEAMGDQLGMFKEQFRPMVWITVLTIPIFLWMWWLVSNPDSASQVGQQGMVFPIAGEVVWNTGIVGPLRTWIVWYFVCSIAFGQLLRKALNIRPTG